MTTIKRDKPAVLMLAFACVVTLAVLFAVTSDRASALPIGASSKIAPELLAPSSAGPTLITVYLTDNSFLSRLPEEAGELLTTTQGSSAARAAAQRSPDSRSNAEQVAASIAESSRNSALPMIRRAGASGAEQNSSVRELIEDLGGISVSASPIPNHVTAYLPRAKLGPLASDQRILRILPGQISEPMAAPIDGSSAWWSGGFTGQGSSADGNGSPDAVVFDTGVRTTHTAFKTRMPGDSPSQDGSGPTRVISSLNRSTFGGSKHANTIGAVIAGTALSYSGTAGIAYGLDKLYDNYQATNPYLWDLGITAGSDPGLAGNTDLPEVINYSAGIYQDEVDLDPLWSYFDALETRFGILNTVSAGNCGIATPSFTNCGDGPHRVSAPGTSANVMTVGGLDTTTVYPDTSGYFPWDNTSPGPTFGGRKKPDVIAPVFGTAGTPSQIDDTTWTSGGEGTSFAAPIAAGGAILMASAGIYKPTAQKALMINTATPVQGQTYWKPRSGWGALNLETAFAQRGNYVNGQTTGAGANSARFFQITGASAGDRSTLVWNRRTSLDNISNPDNSQILGPSYHDLTDLDLSQFASSSPNTPTATGGSDAADAVDTDQTVTADNPMPGDGNDGGDNVEQIRSTGTGTQILKVKAHSAIDGDTSEPFSVASARPIQALSTPIPDVSLEATPSPTGLNTSVTVTATVDNPSSDLSIESASVALNLPTGVTLATGDNPASLGTINESDSATATWTVEATTSGSKNLTATASGDKFGETFSGSGADTFQADGDAPALNLEALPQYSTTTTPAVSWSATDATAVADYDVETSPDATTWTPLLLGTTSTSTNISGTEGETIHVRVRARDTLGNESAWSTTQTTIDAIEPAITIGAPTAPTRGTLSVPVSVSNVGAPIVSSTFTFATSVGGLTGALTPVVTFTNNSTKTVTPTLEVRVFDAIGRFVKKTQHFTAPPRWLEPGLKIRTARTGSGRLRVSGTVARDYAGRVKISVKRKGRVGTRSATKTVRAKSGRFAVSIRLRKGKYRVTVKAPTSGAYLGESATKDSSLR